jgi:hypothetical protein
VVSAVEAALLEFQIRVEQAVVQKQLAFAEVGGSEGGQHSRTGPLSELDLRKQRLRTIVQQYQVRPLPTSRCGALRNPPDPVLDASGGTRADGGSGMGGGGGGQHGRHAG